MGSDGADRTPLVRIRYRPGRLVFETFFELLDFLLL